MGLKPSIAGTAFVIKKCQDANGEWHYGDNAGRECAHSKVIEITNSGVKTKELAAPLTPAQLKAHAAEFAQAAKEKAKARARARRDRILLSMYASSDDITYVRNRKISDVNGLIEGEKDTLKPLQATLSRLQAEEAAQKSTNKAEAAATAKVIANTEAQIAKHKENIKKEQQEIVAIRQQAAADLARYRKLKDMGPGPTPATGDATP
ncbi:MAG: hypothetical protein ACYDB8_05875 [Acidiferrobacterales bacterium]